MNASVPRCGPKSHLAVDDAYVYGIDGSAIRRAPK
jgi:hypothetical protein